MVPNQVRYVVRKLRQSPLFTGVALLTLALAIGANTAVFSVVNGVLLKPLPFEDPDRLVGVWHTAPGLGFDMVNQSPALHYTYLEDNKVFESIGMWDNDSDTVTGLDEPEELPSMYVTDTTLPLLGVKTAIGRLFSPEDDTPDSPRTVILSYGYWQSRFGGDPGVLGQMMRINSMQREIIGVLAEDTQFLDYDPQFYLPFRFDRNTLFIGNFSYQAVARLKDGVTIEQANADVARMIPIATERYPQGITLQMMQEAGFAPALHPLKEDAVGSIGTTLWILLGTVGLVLLIACANVANLFLVRADERQQEVAVRSALGASRAQVTRDFLLETVTLGLLGGVLGVGLAWAGLRLLLATAPAGLPRIDEITIDATVLGFTLAISVLAGVAFGLFPVLRIGQDFVSSLKEGGRGGGAGRERNRARKVLVVAQVAMALVLAIGSGLMFRSFQAMRNIDPGFRDPQHVFTVRVPIPSAEIEEPAQVTAAFELIQQKLGEIGGVQSVGASSSVTMDNWDSNDALEVEDFPTAEGSLPPIRRFKWVTPGYFETMGNPLVAGRTITWADVHDRAPVLVITENLAREYWDSPGEALGKRMKLPQIEGLPWEQVWREVVGVVGDVHDDGVDQDATKTVFWPQAIDRFWDDEHFVARSLVFTLRTERIADAALQDEVRQAIWSVNSNLPLASVRTLAEIQERSMARTSFTLIMLGIAAGAALLLGAVGIYGVSAYVVTQRNREIGIRMALGAQRADVRGMVLSQGMVLVGVGLLIGLTVAAGVTRVMSALLFGVSAIDPLTYGVVALLLASVAVLANWLPAVRATRVDPVEALRWK
ncbi:MAG: ABC transporter permease [Acidobacteriota bacterium]|jgi:predicted permease